VAENKLAYKDMNDKYYYIATVFLFVAAITCSCLINDITPIFEYLSV